MVTVCWVLYYEMDSMAIGKLLGAQEVAVYAIGLTILNFFRSLLGILYSPFNTRFNHFCGQGDIAELRNFYRNIIVITFPLVVIPIIVLTCTATPLVLSWVGATYTQSIPITQWLILCNIFAFVAYPAGMLLYALEKIKAMYVVNVLSVVVFWGGILLTLHDWGIVSFAVFKFVTFVLTGIIYLKLSLDFLQISLWSFIKQIIVPYLPSLLVLAATLFFSLSFFIEEKGFVSLLVNGSIISVNIGLAWIFSLLTVAPLRKYGMKIKKMIL